jgi:PAS domain S-box-containing protein
MRELNGMDSRNIENNKPGATTPTPAALKTVSDSEERFRALVTATSDVVYRMSADWSEMRELQGRGFLSDTGEPNPNWLEMYIHPKDQQRVRERIAQAIATRTIFEMEHQVLRADGTLGWTFSRAVPIFDEHGNIVEWFGAATDVTARRQMQDDLRLAKEEAENSKRLYEAIATGTPDLMYVWDLQYRFTYANKALLAMWGKTWDEAIGVGLRENGYEEWHALMHEREIDEVIATKKSIRGEVSFPHAVLGERIYDYILVPVINEEGTVTAIAGTTRDITEIKLAEAALRRSQEELEELVAERTKALRRSNDDLQHFAHVASHDLKEPMRKIQLFVNMLEENGHEQMNAKGKTYLDKIRKSAARMNAMIDGVLAHSRLDGMDVQPVQVDLNTVIQEVKDDLELVIQQKQAVVNSIDLPLVQGMPVLLSQLFYNLINNALKFARPGVPPVINIAAAPLPGDDRYTCITVEDNGIGFSNSEAERIFQTFTRLHSQEHFEGTGLGLALCRKIVERHQGTIRAEAKENAGARFIIVLPIYISITQGF